MNATDQSINLKNLKVSILLIIRLTFCSTHLVLCTVIGKAHTRVMHVKHSLKRDQEIQIGKYIFK